jgi:lipoate-protein ligase A
MKTILNDSKDPTFNLALEEYVLKELDSDEDFVLLWQNANSVIIGRNQNTYEEINHELVKEHDVKVVRRITGGGAVYHDLGNLNFSFITRSLKDNLNNYRKFTDPVIKVLNELGVPAEFQGRNDIVVDGMKISGNAQAWYKNRMLHHGTILFDANLEFVAKVLNVKLEKIQSKGIKSNRARVTNIKPYIQKPIDLETFKYKLLTNLIASSDLNHVNYPLSESQIQRIQELQSNKYKTWDWNYGESPSSNVIKEKRFLGGNLQLHYDIDSGLIQNFKMFGDFLDTGDVSVISELLNNTHYDYHISKKALEVLEFEKLFFNISLDDLLACLY